MNQSPPTKIERTAPGELTFTWLDNSVCTIALQLLRDECPCASCKGETILGKTYMPLKLPQFTPGMNDVANIQTVGNYAMQIFWKDGHNTGIYTWDYIELLCRKVREEAKE
jgi:DUF971 family protein